MTAALGAPLGSQARQTVAGNAKTYRSQLLTHIFSVKLRSREGALVYARRGSQSTSTILSIGAPMTELDEPNHTHVRDALCAFETIN